ncbi:iron complex outermembrane receptor protein [Sinobacterium caligoides]|uniref:Iron complex outermembrane receptor protein n=1 Tax=Sinobacterium caligoides TaxID=933926 RepID=A0A3N2DNT7_9GAMM|nr:TonB-dependent receptor [Sinobacterium caligoides]ROS01481.1 iron complex outermembrane receptor protein [Sinobacterium caligoides]
MTAQRPLVRAIKLALSGAFIAGATLPMHVANAQEEKTMEEVVITGSRISRDEFASSSPMAVYDATDLENSNASSIDEFLMKTPEFTGSNLGSSTNNGGSGGKMVNLRGLGYKRTLVLINGRRQVSSFVGGPNDLGAVDLNTIPMGMVERIEVLKDGASTAYGSDAIAGVVNVILRKRFDGVKLTGGGGAGTDGWDGKNKDLSFLMGTSNDQGGMVLGLEYHKQEEIIQADRKWGEYSTWAIRDPDTGRFVDEKQGSSNSRTILPVSGGAYVVDAKTGSVRPFNPATDTYNYAPVNALLTPNERWQISAAGDHELFSDSLVGQVNAHAELSYTKRTSHQRLAPDASFGKGSYADKASNFVPEANPYNPFDEDVTVRRRFVESDGRVSNQSVDTYRMNLGFNGELDNGINWDANYVLADNSEIKEYKGSHRYDRWATAVDPQKCAADANCAAAGVLNPFDDFGSITGQQMDYLLANSLKDQYHTRMEQLAFNVNGDLPGLPAGDIGWAIGAEKRTDFAEIKPDEFSAGGLTTGGSVAPLSGEQNVKEYYGELLLPLISDLPLAQQVNLEASVRHSKYDTSAGSNTSYRAAVDWMFNDDFRARTVLSTGFRAPNTVELLSQTVDNPIVENWCEFTDLRNDISDTAKANCASLGYGGMYETGYQYQPEYAQTASTGKLGPEESKTFTFGLVWTPAAIENLRFSVDYFDIEIDSYIEKPDINAMSLTCLESENFSSPACNNFATDKVQGTGIGNKETLGVTQDATSPLANLGTLTTSGLDFATDYAMDINFLSAHTLQAGLSGTWLREYKKDFGDLGSVDYVGTAGSSDVFPEFRINANIGLVSDDWSVQWMMRWMDKSEDLLRPAAITTDAVAEAVLYHDLVATYSYKNLDLSVGVDNVTDVAPPQYHSGFNMHTAPGVYDTIGRRAWFKVGMNF